MHLVYQRNVGYVSGFALPRAGGITRRPDNYRLIIWHVADPSGHRVLFWENNGKKCNVDPPRIKFDDMPCRPRDRSSELGAVLIWAELNITPDDDVVQDSTFLNNSQTVHDIAYKGNVVISVDAYV